LAPPSPTLFPYTTLFRSKIAGSRSYLLTGWGARLHFAALRYAMDFMTNTHGFTPVSVPVLAREEALVGTGFFPAGREQVYRLDRSEEHTSELQSRENLVC